MWYLLKQALVPIAYLFFSAIIASGVFSIDGCDPIIALMLLLVNAGLYIFVVWSLLAKEGEKGLVAQQTNDFNRKRIIETGEDLPLKLAEEYTWWKGFAVGGIISAPLVILIIIHTIFLLAGMPNVAIGAIASFVYMVVFSFTRIGVTTTVGIYDYYWTLLFIPLILAITGFSYIAGARRKVRQQEEIEQIKKTIHGDKG